MELLIAGDHVAADLAKRVEELFSTPGTTVENIGSKSRHQPYPLEEMIPKAIHRFIEGNFHSLVLMCGTGMGVTIGANRFAGIRAVLCHDSQQAQFARVYDDANVLCLGSHYDDNVEEILRAWLTHKFDDDPGRTAMLAAFDGWH